MFPLEIPNRKRTRHWRGADPTVATVNVPLNQLQSSDTSPATAARNLAAVQPPKLIKEVRASYTAEARQNSVAGDVILEAVVRKDGSVGDVRVMRALGFGLDVKAVEAVKQWEFSPALRRGAPVDVIVEVAVTFKLR